MQNVDRSGSLAVALGNETRGCSASLLEAADLHVRIQMRGQVESLNVAVCAGAVLHHLGGEPDGG